MRVRRTLLLAVAATALTVPASALAAADTRVQKASPPSPFSQNKQNEPAIAVDQNHPAVMAAGANDEIDEEACNSGDPTTCPFTPGVGVSGLSFSFDGGSTWRQPQYTGVTARQCQTPGAECQTKDGPIGTLPRFDEAGLVSDGDPALAFGPVYRNGRFSWASGSRLYYASLASALGASSPFRGYEAITVSSTDDPRAAAAGDERAWTLPVVATKQSSSTFQDKEQLWADNVSRSPYFGYVTSATRRSARTARATASRCRSS